jgi:DNA polymerase elongation subunit (family B)
MEQLDYKNFLDQVKSGSISPYQMYNTDIDYPQYFSAQHYLNNPNDNIDSNMPINIGFLDIEVYTQNSGEFPYPNVAKYPMTAITIRCSDQNKYVSFFILNQRNMNKFPYENIKEAIEYYKKELVKNEYITDDEDIEIHLFHNELQMLRACWAYIHNIDPTVLSGWNSSEFDIPYMYQRICSITNDEKGFEAGQIMSKFGIVKKTKFRNSVLINIADYTDMDLLYLYKPRSDGGLNYGKLQPTYTLDWVANAVLGLKKLEYKDSGITLDTFYDKDPLNYLLYNIIDVVLIKKLNEKLRHIEAHNMLRRLMKTPIGLAMRGPSMLFDTMTQYNLTKRGQYTRYGLVKETEQYISPPQVSQIIKPKDNKINWTIEEVREDVFRTIVSRFPGAYVKEGLGRVVTLKDGITIDMDATALYPSMMLQYNISFDSIFGRILDPVCYQFLSLLDKHIGTGVPFPPGMTNKFLEYAKNYVDKLAPQNKGEYVQNTYFILGHLLNVLQRKNIPIRKLMNPEIREHYILLKLYLLPLIDLLTEVHDNSEEYNTFCHDYLLNGKSKVHHVFTIENINEPTIKINRVLVSEFDDYLKTNNISMNLAGTLLYTHEHKLGIFTGFLKEILGLRKEYKDKRDTFEEGSEKYKYYDMRQLSAKVVANSSYGLMGQATFRYSDKWIAKTITVNGRLTLKISQMCGEIYLQHLKNQK